MRYSFLPPALLLSPGAAMAHSGAHDAAAFSAGIMHPLGGADHLIAMVTVGLWAVLSGGRAIWAYPLTFVAAMLAGGIAGSAGATVAGIEPAILASLIVLGALTALSIRAQTALGCALIALFGAAHGMAHGVEGQGFGFGYFAGFTLATASLHLAGIGLGLAALKMRSPLAVRIAGGGAAIAGVWLSVA